MNTIKNKLTISSIYTFYGYKTCCIQYVRSYSRADSSSDVVNVHERARHSHLSVVITQELRHRLRYGVSLSGADDEGADTKNSRKEEAQKVTRVTRWKQSLEDVQENEDVHRRCTVDVYGYWCDMDTGLSTATE